ncbi:AraC family transcriptional regulator [Brachybacterium sp. DNPG3]
MTTPGPPRRAASRWSEEVAAARGAVRRELPTYSAGSMDIPSTILGGQEVLAEDTYWADHAHPTHELIWNERGASTATTGSRVWTIAPAVGLWLPAGTVHSGFTPAGTWQRSAQLSPARTTPLADSPVAVVITDLLRLLLDRLITEDLPSRSRALTEDMVLDVMAPSAHPLLLPVPESALLAPIVDALGEDPADAASLEQWAARLAVSPRTLTRAFEAETGMTFRAWVATARAQHAVTLLSSGLAIDEVADAVGYRSASAFTTAFRRVTGLTPGQFRRSSTR